MAEYSVGAREAVLNPNDKTFVSMAALNAKKPLCSVFLRLRLHEARDIMALSQ